MKNVGRVQGALRLCRRARAPVRARVGQLRSSCPAAATAGDTAALVAAARAVAPTETTGGDGGRGGDTCAPWDCRCSDFCGRPAPPGVTAAPRVQRRPNTVQRRGRRGHRWLRWWRRRLRQGSGGSGGSGGSTAWAPPTCLVICSRPVRLTAPVTRAPPMAMSRGVLFRVGRGGGVHPSPRLRQPDRRRHQRRRGQRLQARRLALFKFEARWHYSCEFASWTWTNGAGETITTARAVEAREPMRRPSARPVARRSHAALDRARRSPR